MTEFRMPSLGADMEAGTLVEWLVQPGSTVSRGDIIAVVETQKGAIEIEVFQNGTVDSLLVEPGSTVPVGTPLAVIADGASDAVEPSTAEPRAAPTPTAPVVAPATVAASPPRGDRVRASPSARKLAAEAQVDLTTLSGSGAGGAILYADVERARQREPDQTDGGGMTAMRSAIAAAMARSKREIPHYYLEHQIDVTDVRDWLEAVNAERPPADRLLGGAVYLKAIAVALRKFPELNGFFEDGRFRPSDAIHVGTAISIRGGGLVAPAIHDTDELSLDQVMARLRDLTKRVRAGRFRSSELADPTVTVSSLGERGVGLLFGVIYPPQVALIGLGRVEERPWIVDDAVRPRAVITATLAADHRVSDGHRGALFLRKLDEHLQHPEAL
jgi:pyruvate dehydrogenase E2 component (dihydrolipoyllysine-residue acetyltransferase)